MTNLVNDIDTLKIAQGRDSRKYALVHRIDGFAVYVLCENYAGHVRGGIAKTWRVACFKDKARRGKMVTGVSKDEAMAYFVRVTTPKVAA